MKRIYQLGEITNIENKELNAIMRAEDGIKLICGEKAWGSLYKEACNHVRKQFKFPYMVAFLCPRDFYDKENLGVIIFEYEADGSNLQCHLDKERNQFYIEIE